MSVWLHVTNECNLRCDYCYVSKSGDEMSSETGRAAVDAILRSAQRHRFRHVKLKFAGGEATLNLRRVLEIHAYALEQFEMTGINLDTVILSNGVFLGENAVNAFKKNGIRISISLDGIGHAHDAQRRSVTGRGSFKWVDRTIHRLLDQDVTPFISITLTARNASCLAETVRYVTKLGLPFNINFFRENECTEPFPDLMLQEEQITQALLAAFAVLENDLPERSLLGSLIDRAQFDAPHNRVCSAGDSYMVIDHNGSVAKCQMEIERTITNILADDPLTALRVSTKGVQNLSVDEKEGCRDCEWRYWCAGGCPILTYRATKRFDVKSPNCAIYKAVYPGLLRLEGLRLLKLANQLHMH